jgi:antitoxin (DNA-binding transcriptional repressor) of toxin-antitoxin stability system
MSTARHARARLYKVAFGSYFRFMWTVGLKVLKNKLSEYVRLAAGGETVLVTARDRVVAELVPPRIGRSHILSDALLAEAVREGWLTPPLVTSKEPPPGKPIAKWREILKELQEDRGAR